MRQRREAAAAAERCSLLNPPSGKYAVRREIGMNFYPGDGLPPNHPSAGALNCAVNRQFPHGINCQDLNLMADTGCQPTSLAFMRAYAGLGIRQAFTSYSNPKGNADTERFLRTLKEELALAAACHDLQPLASRHQDFAT
jgi:transposase InsO family protein